MSVLCAKGYLNVRKARQWWVLHVDAATDHLSHATLKILPVTLPAAFLGDRGIQRIDVLSCVGIFSYGTAA